MCTCRESEDVAVLDIYFKEDLSKGIAAVTVAMLSAAVANGGANAEYCRGVLDTNRAHALNHGIRWCDIAVEVRQALFDGGRGDLLALVEKVRL